MTKKTFRSVKNKRGGQKEKVEKEIGKREKGENFYVSVL